MNPKKLFTLALSLAVFLFATDSAFAKSKPHSKSHGRGNTKEPSKPIDASAEATIEKIGSLSITVKNGTKIENYGIDDHTEILVANVRSSAGALQKGMLVSVRASTLNPTVAQSITVDDPSARTPEPPKAAEPKQGKKKK
jgi:hypothetical protein